MIKLFHRKISFGFSLIEILITTSIMALILTMALVNYNRVVRRQRFEQGLMNILEDLRLARDKAMSGEKSPACLNYPLLWYDFEFDTDWGGYEIVAACDNNGTQVRDVVKSGELDTQVIEIYDGFDSLHFLPLGKGIEISKIGRHKNWEKSYFQGLVIFQSRLDASQVKLLRVSRSGELYLEDYKEALSAPTEAEILGLYEEILGCYLHRQEYPTGGWVNCNDPSNPETYLPCCLPYQCTASGSHFRCL